ncbi:MAG: leucine-rich repeat domain-containing protein, partial [Asgard group archaeon]|nr:leucine-rich repeat domain-containing protein [Asgard group archaeon]
MSSEKIIQYNKIDLIERDALALNKIEEIIGKPLSEVEEIERETIGIKAKDNKVVGLGLFKQGLTELPKSVCDLLDLELLWIRYNKMSVLPESISQLSKLEKINCVGNPLTTLPESIGKLKNLTHIYCVLTEITELPDSICDLPNINQLWVEFGPLEELPENIGN